VKMNLKKNWLLSQNLELFSRMRIPHYAKLNKNISLSWSFSCHIAVENMTK
jgi:hypothetical protein